MLSTVQLRKRWRISARSFCIVSSGLVVMPPRGQSRWQLPHWLQPNATALPMLASTSAVGARDQHLDHVQLAAQAARGEQPRAAAGAERRAVQVADRLQLAASRRGRPSRAPARDACAGWCGRCRASRRARSRRGSCPSRRARSRPAGSRRRSWTTCRPRRTRVVRAGDLDAAVVVVEQPQPDLGRHVLDRVDVVLGIGRQRVGADRDVARPAHRRRDLGAREPPALAGLGALVDLDLDVAHAAQVGGVDAEVPARRLHALPRHVLVAGEADRPALARRRHREPGVALDARDQEVLGRRAERDAGVAHRPVPDRLAEAEARRARSRRAARAAA